MSFRSGSSLYELLITIAILAILFVMALVAIDPAGQFAIARNDQRELHVQAILTAVRQNVADNRLGKFVCAGAGDIPTSTIRMAVGEYDIAPCLVPSYLQNMPFDPKDSNAFYNNLGAYDTGYEIVLNDVTGEITISAPSAELGKIIFVTR
jgi:type II secretory pathway pseudopilin PulG